jgi:hypothetical protein
VSQRHCHGCSETGKRSEKWLGIGAACMHLDHAPVQVTHAPRQLCDHEHAPGTAVLPALVSQVQVIRADHIIGGEQSVLRAHDVPGPAGADRKPPTPGEHRAGEQVRGRCRGPQLSAHTADQHHVGSRTGLAKPAASHRQGSQVRLRRRRTDLEAVVYPAQQRRP